MYTGGSDPGGGLAHIANGPVGCGTRFVGALSYAGELQSIGPYRLFCSDCGRG